MKGNVEERAVELGEYIAKTNATVRLTAKKYNISKSTVLPYLSSRQPMLSLMIRDTMSTILLLKVL